jgi:ribosomal protein S18 acetylase RimI-like enzyme
MVVSRAQLPLPDAADDDLELKRIYLLGKFRGGGIGKNLIAVAEQYSRASRASRLLLGVYAHNHSAISFYKQNGFGKLGNRKFNVGGQDYDDVIMGMPLHI